MTHFHPVYKPFHAVFNSDDFRVFEVGGAHVIESAMFEIDKYFVYPLHYPRWSNCLGSHIHGVYMVLLEEPKFDKGIVPDELDRIVANCLNDPILIVTWEMMRAKRYMCYRTFQGYFHTLEEAVLGMNV